MLEERKGTRGTVRVEERGGLKVLTIDGQVQGATALGQSVAAAAVGDPLVVLAGAMNPKPRTALLLGLGTGRTAAGLAAAGLAVEVVEIEQAVVELARKHFGYRGHVVVADAWAFVQQPGRRYDIVVVDFETGTHEPGKITRERMFSLLSDRLSPGGTVAFRLHRPPDHPAVDDLLLGSNLEYRAGFASGIGSEQQNLYLFFSRRPFELDAPRGLPVWPLFVPGQEKRPAFLKEMIPPARGDDLGASRRTTVLGYLIRMHDGALAIDLPHWEMGAVRFRLDGEPARALAERLPREARFPTQGDLRSDGDVSRTLAPMLGGGGSKRSETRFSTLAVVVEGMARTRSVVAPDATLETLAQGTPPARPLLPYGGVLYDLQVTRVVRVFDRPFWDRVQRRLSSDAKQVIRLLRQGDLPAALPRLRTYHQLLAEMLSPVGELVPALTETATLISALEAALRPDRAKTRSSAACGELLDTISIADEATSHTRPFVAALAACAGTR